MSDDTVQRPRREALPTTHRPPTDRRRVPIGVEKVLYLAATDRAFRAVLRCDRREALRQWSLSLTPGEEAILDSVSPATLDAMIEAVRPDSDPRRRFLRAVAAASAAAVGVLELTACEMSTKGIRPDLPDAGPDAGPDAAPAAPPPPDGPPGEPDPEP